MRSTNVILIIALLSIQIFAVKIDFSSFVELSDLKGDSYAQSLVQTINTALQNQGGRIESIQDLLVELYNKLVQDQASATKVWTARETALNESIADNEQTISKLGSEIADAEKALAETEIKITAAQDNIKQYTDQRTADEVMRTTLAEKRAKDAAVFEENKRNHGDLIIAVDAVVAELSKLKGSISGQGKPAHIEDIEAETRDTAWKKAQPALLQVFSRSDIASFVEVATQADQDALEKLIDMLLTLKKSAEKSLADDEASEQVSKTLYKKADEKLAADVKDLTEAITKQTDNLGKYERAANSFRTEIADKTQLKVKTEALLKSNLAIRAQEKARYDADKAGRLREREIIARLQKIVEEKLKKMKDFLRKRVNTD